MEVGVFGGSFDPFHCGHLAAARAGLAAGLDAIWLVPARVSPFKQDEPPAPGSDRWAMALLGTLEEPAMRVLRLELDRDGPSYAIDTLEELQARHPEVRASWLVGADQLAGIDRWHRSAELLERCAFWVVPRRGFSADDLAAAIAATPRPDRFRALEMEPVDLSSSAIRTRAAAGEPLAGLVPRLTATYLERYNPYRPLRP